MCSWNSRNQQCSMCCTFASVACLSLPMPLLPPALTSSRKSPDGINADSNNHPLGCRFGHVLVFVAFSFWVPQIIYCAATDSRQPLSALYMWGMSLTRLALPLYLLTCPHNLLRIEPRPVAGTLLVLWVAAQVGGADWMQLRCFQASGPMSFTGWPHMPPCCWLHWQGRGAFTCLRQRCCPQAARVWPVCFTSGQ